MEELLRSRWDRLMFRREWRAAMKGRGFLGRNGRSAWTPKRKVKSDRKQG